jgi:hypothetical protein
MGCPDFREGVPLWWGVLISHFVRGVLISGSPHFVRGVLISGSPHFVRGVLISGSPRGVTWFQRVPLVGSNDAFKFHIEKRLHGLASTQLWTFSNNEYISPVTRWGGCVWHVTLFTPPPPPPWSQPPSYCSRHACHAPGQQSMQLRGVNK